MTVGLLAHLVGKLPYEQLAAKVASYGFDYVQLALSKAVADVDCSFGKLSPGLGNTIGGAFHSRGVKVAVLGCYVSLVELDDEVYRRNVDQFKEHLRNARHFGASIVATEVGVPKTDQRELHWQRLRAAVAELAEEAEKWGVYVGLEAAARHLIGTASELAQILQEVPSANIGVVLDPCNLLTQSNYKQQDEIIEEAFRLLGTRIVSAHAKDFVIDPAAGELQMIAAGRGMLNYDKFMGLMNHYKPHSFITLERVPEQHMFESSAFIRRKRVDCSV
ncbi:sugar phosphate isomerase/epimerase family protein [Paenibacillus xerothermodurans]|uniref:Sugar phosphate isomerase/epimerase n=1 Tax=Paenibacillus xerothermodurans TaxID=1977292 RepID=A0A2W1NQU7_PAEXE|nr:sugar phosphate isomerase/epimerase family protein [Paenibacillus xerothermodurans]PZE21243.1 sugar phosphate isomerase/epimerase [Paenibacillus xerothermodurans]